MFKTQCGFILFFIFLNQELRWKLVAHFCFRKSFDDEQIILIEADSYFWPIFNIKKKMMTMT